MTKWVKVPETVSGEELAEETREMKAASIMVSGGNINQVAKEFGLSHRQAQRLVNSDGCKALIKKLGDEAYADAVSMIKHGAKERVNKAFKVVDNKLDKNDLKAAELIFKLLNPDMAPEEAKSDTSINIIMPTGIKDSPIDVTPKTEKI